MDMAGTGFWSGGVDMAVTALGVEEWTWLVLVLEPLVTRVCVCGVVCVWFGMLCVCVGVCVCLWGVVWCGEV